MLPFFVSTALAFNCFSSRSLQAQTISPPNTPASQNVAPDTPQSPELPQFVSAILESLAQGRFYKNGDIFSYVDKQGHEWISDFRDAQTFIFERRTVATVDVPENKARPRQIIHASAVNTLACLGYTPPTLKSGLGMRTAVKAENNICVAGLNITATEQVPVRQLSTNIAFQIFECRVTEVTNGPVIHGHVEAPNIPQSDVHSDNALYVIHLESVKVLSDGSVTTASLPEKPITLRARTDLTPPVLVPRNNG